MKNSDFIKVGRVSGAHSLKGEIYVHLKAETADWAQKSMKVRLCSPQRLDQFEDFVTQTYRIHRKGLILKFTEITDRTAAERYRAWDMYIPAEMLVTKPGERIFLHELLDFRVFDGEELVGNIKTFQSNLAQDLLVVENKNGEVLIPFVQEFIEKVDFVNKFVYMQLPEGLLNLEEKKLNEV